MSDGSVVIDVELDDKGVDQGTAGLVGKFKNVALAVTGVIGGLALIGKSVSAFTNLSKGAIQAAAGAQALSAQFEQVFGSISGQAQETINKLASDFGMVPSRIKPMFTQMTSQFKGLGLSTEEAAVQAAKATTMVADAAAFYDKSFEDANAALNSFVKGNYEGGEAIGLFANETQLAAWASDNLGVNWKKLDEAGKQVARLQFAEAMQASAGATGQAARESDGLENVLGNLKAVWQDFLIELGTPILPIVIELMQRLTGIIQEFNFDPFIAGFSAIWDVLGNVANAALDVITSISTSFGEGGILGAMGIDDGLVSTVEGYLSTMKDIFSTYFDGIVAVVKYVFDLFKSYGPPIIKEVVDFISKQLKQLETFWRQNGDQIVQAVTNAFNAVKAVIDFIMPAIKVVVQIVWDAIKNVITGALNVIQGAIKVFSGLFTGDWSKMWEGIKQILSGAIDLIMGLLTLSFVGGIRALLTNLAKAAGNLVKGMWDDIAKWFTQFSTSIPRTVEKMATGIINYFKNILTNATTIFNTLRSTGTSIWNALSQAVTSVVRTIFNTVKNQFTSMVNTVRTLSTQIKSVVTKAWESVMTYLRGINLTQIGKDVIQGLINGIGSLAGSVYNKMKEIGSGMLSTFKGVLGIKSPAREMIEAGKDTVAGLNVGIDNEKGTTDKVMKELGNVVLKAADDNAKKVAEQRKKTDEEVNKVLQESAKKQLEIRTKANQDVTKAEASLDKSLTSSKKKTAAAKATIVSESKKKQADLRSTANKKIAEEQAKADEKIAEILKKGAAEETKIRQQADADRLASIKAYISNKKDLEGLSIIDEATLWRQSVKQFKDGTAEQLETRKQYFATTAKLNDDMLASNETFQKKMADVYQKLEDEEKRLTDVYKKSVEDRERELTNFVGVFDKVDEAIEVSGKELTQNLKDQVNVLTDWTEEFEKLSKRAVDDGLVEELRKMGPKALPQLKALNRMTEEELAIYSAIYAQKSIVARSQAVKENEGLLADTQKQLKELQDIANKELTQLEKDWVKQIQSLRTSTQRNLNLEAVGRNAIQGLMNGMDSMRGALDARAKAITDSVKKTITKALDIHSPSRWMRNIVGKNMMLGWMLGFDDEKSAMINKASDVVDWATPDLAKVSSDFVNMVKGVNPAQIVGANQIAQKVAGGHGGNTSKQTVYSPQITNHFTPAESTPSENIRKQRQLLERLGMDYTG